MRTPTTVTADYLGRPLTLETGRFALLSQGSVMLRWGDNVIFAACNANAAKDGMDFLPLNVEFQDKFYATGNFKTNKVNKREGRPTDEEILRGRLIDRTIRPLFPYTLRNDIQVVVNILASDGTGDLSDLCITAASTAIMLAGLPFQGPAAGAKIGLDATGQLLPHPSYAQDAAGGLELMLGGTAGAILMVEAVANELPEERIVEAMELATKCIGQLCAVQNELIAKVQPTPHEGVMHALPADELKAAVSSLLTEHWLSKLYVKTKAELNVAEKGIYAYVLESLKPEIDAGTYTTGGVKEAIFATLEAYVRKNLIEHGKRLDGRGFTEIRPLFAEGGVLPSVHGSGHFKRGDTQALSVVTLGSPGDILYVEEADREYKKSYFHHYNMPGYSVGEAKMNRGVSRREVGHGNLAERAMRPVLPATEDFPYTIRVVSEIMTSNGSTSMAATCGSCLALMDAGVPLRRPVSGIAMGLVIENETYRILSDIQGMEDFTGDMDFKVAGTTQGITALQMDIKVAGITLQIMREALAQAKDGRAHILATMLAAVPTHKPDLAPNAPRITSVPIKYDSIGLLIGPGGKNINAISEASGAQIDIDDEKCLVFVTSKSKESAEKALAMIRDTLWEPTAGDIVTGKVAKVLDFGAVVEFGKKDGLLHISELAHRRIGRVEEVVNVGDTVTVKILRIEGERGREKISLSLKALQE